MSPSAEKTHLALIARVGRRRCAIPLSQVTEVLRPLPIDALPTTLEAVLGVATLRGQTVPVIDPAQLIGEAASGKPTRFVALRMGERSTLLAVDEIIGVRDLAAGTLGSLPPLLQSVRAETVSQIGQLDQDLLVVLRSARFFESDLQAGAPEGTAG